MTQEQVVQQGYGLAHQETGVLLRLETYVYEDGCNEYAFSEDISEQPFIVDELYTAHRALYFPSSCIENSTYERPYSCPKYINLNNYTIVRCEVLIKTVPCELEIPKPVPLNKNAILYVFGLNKTNASALGLLSYVEQSDICTGVLINESVLPRQNINPSDLYYRGGTLCRVKDVVSLNKDIESQYTWLKEKTGAESIYLIIDEHFIQ